MTGVVGWFIFNTKTCWCWENSGEEIIITRLRIGHTGLSHTLYKIGKHQTGKCMRGSEPETVEHVLLQCGKYSVERGHLLQSMGRAGPQVGILTTLLS